MRFFIVWIFLFSMLFGFNTKTIAQNTLKEYSPKLNTMRMSMTFTKGFYSYERLLKKHFSAGIIGGLAGGTYKGYNVGIFGRFYFSEFHRSGFFLEAQGAYAHYTTTAYSSYYESSTQDDDITFIGEHKANIESFQNMISLGGNLFCNEMLYIEMQAGFRFASTSYGEDDLYFQKRHLFYPPTAELLDWHFTSMGMPGSPFYFRIHLGIIF